MKLLWLGCDVVAVGDRITLSEEHLHHLRDVLRIQLGARLVARTPSMPESLLHLDVVFISKNSLEVELVALDFVTLPKTKVELVQGYPKATKFDDVLRMAIEAGASRVIPVTTDFGDVKDLGRLKKEDRWSRIAREAIEQSGNLGYNKIDNAVTLNDFLIKEDRSADFLEVVCHPPLVWKAEEDLLSLPQVMLTNASTIRLFVGPEGGFSPAELALFEARKAIFYRFGSTILRTEHAGLYAISTINTLLQYKGV